MENITASFSFGLEDFSSCKEIRQEVFMDEQGFKNEFDEKDKESYHLLLRVGGENAGTARFFKEEESVYHAGRICIRKKFRGLGLGRILISELSAKIKELGGRKILISAQKDKEGFYQKQGFSSYGEVYNDEHCPHIDMKKIL